jgi:cobalt-zinc-cadmium efflux system membrane fusion protein
LRLESAQQGTQISASQHSDLERNLLFNLRSYFVALRQAKAVLVSANAILHLHDREWVFVPAGGNRFRRVEVRGGNMLSGDRQEILFGISPGQQVVSNVLQLESTLEAQ